MADDGNPPRVLLLATGGTISMQVDAAKGGAVPSLTGRQILDALPGVDRIASVEVREFGRYPGPHMTIERMWELRAAILTALAEDFVGVVVTHGTDTLEETSYLLDRSLPADKPVVMTGAMRNATELSWDGPVNLMAAIEVAVARESRGRGTMVVMDEEIVQGAEVVKTHTEAAGTFRSPNWGPLGVTDKGEALFYRESRRKAPLMPASRPMRAPSAPVMGSGWLPVGVERQCLDLQKVLTNHCRFCAQALDWATIIGVLHEPTRQKSRK